MILSAHLEKNDIHLKTGSTNFVTVYDAKIQRFLIAELSDILPGTRYYGEGDIEGNESRGAEGYTVLH